MNQTSKQNFHISVRQKFETKEVVNLNKNGGCQKKTMKRDQSCALHSMS